MNLSDLQKHLLSAAKRHSPSDRVPYAFEKRILARLQEGPSPIAVQRAEWRAWSRALWLGAAACMFVAVLTSVCAPSLADDASTSFAAGVEQSMWDDVDNVW